MKYDDLVDRKTDGLVDRFRERLRLYMHEHKLSIWGAERALKVHGESLQKILQAGALPRPNVMDRILRIIPFPSRDRGRLIEACREFHASLSSRNRRGCRAALLTQPRTNQNPMIREAARLFRLRLQADMRRRRVKLVTDYARALGVSYGTLNRFFREDSDCLPSRHFLREVRARIDLITDEDAAQIENAFWTQHSERQPRTEGRKRNLRKSRLAAAQSSNGARPIAAGKVTPSRPVDIPQRLLEVLLASGLKRFQVGDFPYILSTQEFSRISTAKWTEAEKSQLLDFVNFVLEQARLCMLVLAQLSPDKVRENVARKIGQNADLLWRTYKVASSIVPIEYLDSIDLGSRLK